MSMTTNTIGTFHEDTSETCEICGEDIDDEVHNWMIDTYFVHTPQPPRYEDDVLALCETCCNAVEKKWRAEQARHQPTYRSLDDPWSPSGDDESEPASAPEEPEVSFTTALIEELEGIAQRLAEIAQDDFGKAVWTKVEARQGHNAVNSMYPTLKTIQRRLPNEEPTG